MKKVYKNLRNRGWLSLKALGALISVNIVSLDSLKAQILKFVSSKGTFMERFKLLSFFN